jgi:mono/diheme cytochrome c family protein
MRKLLKILGIVLGTLVVLLAVAITATIGWRPFIGPRTRPLTDRKFQSTPQRLERGRYLAEDVAGCMHCHSEHDWSQPGGPVMPGKMGAGDIFPLEGLPGRIVAPNLTPDPETGSGTWTDDQLARAIREGVGHDGRALFPMMPYEKFRHMSDEDLASVIVFLRSLPPVRNPLPKTEIIFPVKYLIRSAPQPVIAPVPPPDVSTPVRRGAYLANLADCITCHTPVNDKQQPLPGMEFAGGWVLKGPWGSPASANITPDASGISYYDETLFLEVMRTGKVKARQLNSIMPWLDFRNMTDEDLKAVFAYLKTVKPVQHRVDNTEPPTFCKKCGGVHGLGDRN